MDKRRGFLVLLSALALFCVGCGSKDTSKSQAPNPNATTESTSPKAKGGTASKESAGQASEAKPVADNKTEAKPAKTTPSTTAATSTGSIVGVGKVAAHLPKDVFATASLGNLTQVMNALGRETLVAKFKQQYDAMTTGLIAMAGHNLLEPANLAQIGIDPKGQFGVALTSHDFDDDEGVFFFALSDRGKFKTFLQSMAEKVRMSPEIQEINGVTVLRRQGAASNAFILLDKYCLFMGARNSTKGEALLKRLLAVTPATSLASSADYKASLEGLEPSHAGAYLNIKALFSAGMDAMKASTPPESFWAKELKDAEASGDPKAIARAKERLAEETRWEARRTARRAAEAKVATTLFGSVVGLGVSGTLAPDAMEFVYRFRLAPGAAVGKMLKNRKSASGIVKATDEVPVFLMSASIDAKAGMALLLDLARADGMDDRDLKELNTFLGGLGIKLEGLFGELLGEDFGFSLTGDVAKLLSGNIAPMSVLKGTLVMEVKNAEKVKALLAALTLLPGVGEQVKAQPDGSFQVKANDVTVRIGIDGGYLTISNSDAAGKALSSGQSKSFVNKLSSRAKALVSRTNTAGTFMLDQSFLVSMFMNQAHVGSDYESVGKVRQLAGEPPFSAAYEAKQKELSAFKKQMRDERVKAQQKQNQQLLTLMSGFGSTAMVVEASPQAVVMRGGQYFKGKIADFMVTMIESMVFSNMESGPSMGSSSWEKRDRLERELRDIRAKTLKEHAAKPAAAPKATPPPADMKAPAKAPSGEVPAKAAPAGR